MPFISTLAVARGETPSLSRFSYLTEIFSGLPDRPHVLSLCILASVRL